MAFECLIEIHYVVLRVSLNRFLYGSIYVHDYTMYITLVHAERIDQQKSEKKTEEKGTAMANSVHKTHEKLIEIIIAYLLIVNCSVRKPTAVCLHTEIFRFNFISRLVNQTSRAKKG